MWGQAWEQTDRAPGQQQGEEGGGGVEKGLWGDGCRRGRAAAMAEYCLRSTADGSVTARLLALASAISSIRPIKKELSISLVPKSSGI